MSLISRNFSLQYLFVPATLGLNVFASLAVAFGLGYVPLVLLIAASTLALGAYSPRWTVLLSIIILPLVGTLRLALPATVNVAGVSFVAVGGIKELAQFLLWYAVMMLLLRRRATQLNPLPWPLAIYLALAAIGALRMGSWLGLMYLRPYVLPVACFFLAPLFLDQVWTRRLATVLVCNSTVMAGVGLWRYFVDPTFLQTAFEASAYLLNPVSVRILAPESGVYRLDSQLAANDTAVYLVLGFMSAIYLATSSRWFPSWVLYPWSVVVLAAILLTQSRTGVTVLVACLLTFVVTQWRRARNLRYLAGIGVGMLGAVILLDSLQLSGAMKRLVMLEEPRFFYWNLFWRQLGGISFDSLFGVGLGAFGGVGLQADLWTYGSTADNAYMQILVELGMIALLPLLLFFVRLGYKAARHLGSQQNSLSSNILDDHREMMLALLLFVCIGISSLVGVTFHSPYFGPIFWLAAGILYAGLFRATQRQH